MFVEHYRCYLGFLQSVMYIRPHPFGCVRIHMDSPADCFFRKEDEGFDLIYVLPPSRPAASRCPLDICIQMGSNPYPCNKKYGYPNGYPYFLAEDEGFEPPQTESESGVLPLHKSSIAGTFVIIRSFLKKSRSFLKNFQISDEGILTQKRRSYSSHGKGFPCKTWSFKYRNVFSSPSSLSMVSR